jgi:serpin B
MQHVIINSFFTNHRTMLALGLGGVLFGGAASSVFGQDEPSAPTSLKALCDGNEDFAFNFYRQGLKPGENLVFSPHGISECFAMLYAGSEDVSSKVLGDIFRFPVPPKELLASFGKLHKALAERNDEDGCRIDIANSCWANEGIPVRPEYASALKSDIGADMFSVDFRDTTGVQLQMDKWVEEHTGGMIKKAPGKITPLDLLVLMNTVYLDANWASSFAKEDTMDRPFVLANGESIDVPTMWQIQSHRYHHAKGARILDLPYVGDQTSMMIIVPDEGRSLADLEAELSSELVDKWTRKLEKRKLSLLMPKFKIGSELNLKTIIEKMSSVDVFGRMDLGNMFREGRPEISEALQNALIEVDEDGTKAAAVTYIRLGRSAPSRVEKPTEVKLDRPFMYIVRDRSLGTIHFMGRVMDPRGQ